MSLRVVSEFAPRWTVCWATSYTFDLGFFDEFLFRRLGNPPVNATLLVDFDRFAEAWDEVREQDEVELGRVNRDYLLRGVRWPGGAFHPKTYFLANRRDGLLLVGSGNLGLDGLDRGAEVFSRFPSGDPEGLAAIRAWRDWMGRIVVHLADRQVTARWLDLQEQAAWLAGAGTSSAFVTNWDASFLDQLARVFDPPVDELHLLAPFYDLDAFALQRLIGATQPRIVYLYAPNGISLDGPRTRAVLEGAGVEAQLSGYDRNDYVHAKLVGITKGNDGALLSGSPNASRVALLSTLSQGGWGNVEAGTLVRIDAAAVRAAFCPPGWELRALPLADLDGFRPSEDAAPGHRPPISLESAVLQTDGSVVVRFVPEREGEIRLSSGTATVRVMGDRTAGPLALPAGGSLVWLVDADGATLSNKVPVDDPVRLKSWLQERSELGDRPRELAPQDFETPIGQMLERLNREYIFDVDDTAAASGAVRQAGSEGEDTDDTGFWERFQAEELRLDPRAARYERGATRGEIGLPIEDDDISALLRLMLDRVRGEEGVLLKVAATIDVDAVATGHSWSPERRLQVRLENVLRRWSRALADARLRWLDPLAPLRNYQALQCALVESWQARYLREEQVVRVAFDLFSGFVRDERRAGYLLSLPDDERMAAIAAIGPTPPVAAALAYAALRPTTAWKERVFDWQPFLVPALRLGVVQADEDTVGLVERLLGVRLSPKQINDQLRRSATYTTDERWENRVEAELGLERVEIALDPAGRTDFPLTVEVWGIADPINEPSLVGLVRRAFAYRDVRGLRLAFPDRSKRDRMSFSKDGPAFGVIDGVEYECEECASESIMTLLEEETAGWGTFMSEVGSEIRRS